MFIRPKANGGSGEMAAGDPWEWGCLPGYSRKVVREVWESFAGQGPSEQSLKG